MSLSYFSSIDKYKSVSERWELLHQQIIHVEHDKNSSVILETTSLLHYASMQTTTKSRLVPVAQIKKSIWIW